jgi:hypothetical protein
MAKNNLHKGLSTISVIILTVLITAVVVGGGMYYFQINTTAETKVDKKLIPTATPTPPTLTLNEINLTAAAENNTNGTIKGTFIFPSEGIPETIRACAENTENAQITCSGTLKETGLNNTFSFEVPAGKYRVYAESGLEGQQNYKAYYTEFVTCGLLASCPSHEKIIVTVEVDETVPDIMPHDWYDPSQNP